MIYIDLTLVALVTIYIVDISGFTDAWRGWLARRLRIKALRPLPPFDCGKCMSWWMCLLFALCSGELSLYTIAFSALISLLSIPIGQLMIFIREGFIALTNKLIDLCS